LADDGYIQPEPEYLEKMFFRKPGLPILMVKFPDGKKVPYNPLGQGNRKGMFSEPAVTALAEKYHKNEAQVLLRFLNLQQWIRKLPWLHDNSAIVPGHIL
jgi:hypothetical protein